MCSVYSSINNNSIITLYVSRIKAALSWLKLMLLLSLPFWGYGKKHNADAQNQLKILILVDQHPLSSSQTISHRDNV